MISFVIVHRVAHDTPDSETKVVGRKPTYRAAKRLAAKLRPEFRGYLDVQIASAPTPTRASYLRTRDTETANAMHRARRALKASPFDTDLMEAFRRAVRAYAHAHRTLAIGD